MNDNEDNMPIVTPQQGFSSYTHGGRSPIDGGQRVMVAPHCFKRPLNPYVHPNLPLGGTLDGGRDPNVPEADLRDPEQYNFPVFECPGDKDFNWQRNGNGDQSADYSMSCYHFIGTSYTFNLTWMDFQNVYPDFDPIPTTKDGFNQGKLLFRRAKFNYPSQFVAYFDDPADYMFWTAEDCDPTHHGIKNDVMMAFLDGHAKFVIADPKDPNTNEYWLYFPEREKGN
jgi:prepilin-type processing-associated H-X9-DG protein